MNLAGVVAAKVVASVALSGARMVTGRPSVSTRRVDRSSASQAYAWLFEGPDVVFTDPDSGATVSIGSARNAAMMKAEEFDYVINCCPREIAVNHPCVRTLDLADTDDVSLAPVLGDLQRICTEVSSMLRTGGGTGGDAGGDAGGEAGARAPRILCHCWMGASRSVAVAIFVLCMVYGPVTKDGTPSAEFHYWYSDFKTRRPCINVSVRLMNEVCRLLDDAQPIRLIDVASRDSP